MDRALKASDPRFARILGKLGYSRSDMADAPSSLREPPKEPRTASASITDLRDEYQIVVGKKPFMGWDAETLAAKIAEASSQ